MTSRQRIAGRRVRTLAVAGVVAAWSAVMVTPVATASTAIAVTVGTPTLQAGGAAVAVPLTVTCPSGAFFDPVILSQTSGGGVISQQTSDDVICDGTAHHALAVATYEFGLTRPWRTGPALVTIDGLPQGRQLKKVTIATGAQVPPSKAPGLILPATITRIAGGLTLKVPVRIRCPRGQFASVDATVDQRVTANLVTSELGETTPLCSGSWQTTSVPVDAAQVLWRSGTPCWLSVFAYTDSVEYFGQGVVTVP